MFIRIRVSGKWELLQTRNGFIQLVDKLGCGLRRIELAADIADNIQQVGLRQL